MASTGGRGNPGTTVRLATSNEDAQQVRIVRGTEPADLVIAHETLADGIFDEINNVVNANFILSEGQDVFMLGEHSYYKIYSYRKNVDLIQRNTDTFVRAALYSFPSVSPFLH